MNSRWTACFRTAAYRAAALCLVLATLTLVGCGGGGAKVSGKVTSNGQPVTGGTVTFAPVPAEGDATPGAPSSGTVQSDGAYALVASAVVGKNRISYSPPASAPPAGTTTTGQPPPAATPFTGLVPKQAEVEIKAGDNKIDIELAPPTPGKP